MKCYIHLTCNCPLLVFNFFLIYIYIYILTKFPYNLKYSLKNQNYNINIVPQHKIYEFIIIYIGEHCLCLFFFFMYQHCSSQRPIMIHTIQYFHKDGKMDNLVLQSKLYMGFICVSHQASQNWTILFFLV